MALKIKVAEEHMHEAVAKLKQIYLLTVTNYPQKLVMQAVPLTNIVPSKINDIRRLQARQEQFCPYLKMYKDTEIKPGTLEEPKEAWGGQSL